MSLTWPLCERLANSPFEGRSRSEKLRKCENLSHYISLSLGCSAQNLSTQKSSLGQDNLPSSASTWPRQTHLSAGHLIDQRRSISRRKGLFVTRNKRRWPTFAAEMPSVAFGSLALRIQQWPKEVELDNELSLCLAGKFVCVCLNVTMCFLCQTVHRQLSYLRRSRCLTLNDWQRSIQQVEPLRRSPSRHGSAPGQVQDGSASKWPRKSIHHANDSTIERLASATPRGSFQRFKSNCFPALG